MEQKKGWSGRISAGLEYVLVSEFHSGKGRAEDRGLADF